VGFGVKEGCGEYFCRITTVNALSEMIADNLHRRVDEGKLGF
jgi:hypothetical protein